MDRNELIQIARECEIPNSVIYADELEKFAQRIRAAALREGASECKSLAYVLGSDRGNVANLCAEKLLKMAECDK